MTEFGQKTWSKSGETVLIRAFLTNLSSAVVTNKMFEDLAVVTDPIAQLKNVLVRPKYSI